MPEATIDEKFYFENTRLFEYNVFHLFKKNVWTFSILNITRFYLYRHSPEAIINKNLLYSNTRLCQTFKAIGEDMKMTVLDKRDYAKCRFYR